MSQGDTHFAGHRRPSRFLGSSCFDEMRLPGAPVFASPWLCSSSWPSPHHESRAQPLASVLCGARSPSGAMRTGTAPLLPRACALAGGRSRVPHGACDVTWSRVTKSPRRVSRSPEPAVSDGVAFARRGRPDSVSWSWAQKGTGSSWERSWSRGFYPDPPTQVPSSFPSQPSRSLQLASPGNPPAERGSAFCQRPP